MKNFLAILGIAVFMIASPISSYASDFWFNFTIGPRYDSYQRYVPRKKPQYKNYQLYGDYYVLQYVDRYGNLHSLPHHFRNYNKCERKARELKFYNSSIINTYCTGMLYR